MALESTMICFDNSEFMRNGDFIPSRLQAEIEAVDLITQCKMKLHPENNVGLLTMAAERIDVLSTLTADPGRLAAKVHQIRPKGECRFLNAIRVAHLALKHRQNRNHKVRIVVFIGSPIEDDVNELVKAAKKLKKEKVNVDIVSFGEESQNIDKLNSFIETLNGKDGTGSRMVSVPPGSHMSQALVSSAIVRGEDGAAPSIIPRDGGGYEFGIDPNEDPELAMALRISMEEQRARQEEEARRVAQESAQAATPGGIAESSLANVVAVADSKEPNLDAMTEEEQIAYALQMSLAHPESQPMDTTESTAETASTQNVTPVTSAASLESADFSSLVMDPQALEALVASLPGMDANSQEGQAAIANIRKAQKDKTDESKRGNEGSGGKDSNKK